MNAPQRIPMNELLQRLEQELNYSAPGAELVAKKIHAMTEEVYLAFEKWWKEGITLAFERHGYSIQGLIESQGLNPIAAFLTMDWLVREPTRAVDAIRCGYDKVIIPQK